MDARPEDPAKSWLGGDKGSWLNSIGGEAFRTLVSLLRSGGAERVRGSNPI